MLQSVGLQRVMSIELVMPSNHLILFFVVCFSSCLQSFSASGTFQMSQFFTSGGQSFEASASVLPMNRRLLLGIKAMTNLDSILKSKDVTLPTTVYLVKAMVFPVVMYGCESWTVKKAEHRRTDAFELWCWRRLLRVPWTARRSNQSILKEISPEYSLEGLMLKLKLQ